jgi:hypothetical protein
VERSLECFGTPILEGRSSLASGRTSFGAGKPSSSLTIILLMACDNSGPSPSIKNRYCRPTGDGLGSVKDRQPMGLTA